MVAITFAGMAMDAVQEGKSGLMTAMSSGCYAMVPIPDPKLGPRKVDVATMYNTQRTDRLTISSSVCRSSCCEASLERDLVFDPLRPGPQGWVEESWQ